MKLQKQFLFIVALLAATLLNADPGNHNPVILTPTPTNPTHGDDPRSPVAVPVFYQDGYTLTASDYTVGSTVELLDEDARRYDIHRRNRAVKGSIFPMESAVEQ